MCLWRAGASKVRISQIIFFFPTILCLKHSLKNCLVADVKKGGGGNIDSPAFLGLTVMVSHKDRDMAHLHFCHS